MTVLRFHGVCDLFPPMSDDEFSALVADIGANGVQVPVATYQGSIIDGKHRWNACKTLGIECPTLEWDGRGSLVEHVVSLNLQRRHLTAGQKAALAVDLLPMLEAEAKERVREGGRVGGESPAKGTARMPEASRGESREKAAAVVHVAPRYVSDAKKLRDTAPEKFARVRSGEITIPEAKKEILTEARRAREATPVGLVADQYADRYEIHACSAVALIEHVAPGSVDLVLTDPPYPREFLETYDELGRFAAHALRPGGVLLAMAGQSYLPDVIERLSRHLTYHWTLCYWATGVSTQIWARRMKSEWKPVLMYVKGEYSGEHNTDAFRSEPSEAQASKFHHVWGQSETPFAAMLHAFSRPGALIADPFLGGGTTAVVAVVEGRNFIGCDIDPEALAASRKRLSTLVR